MSPAETRSSQQGSERFQPSGTDGDPDAEGGPLGHHLLGSVAHDAPSSTSGPTSVRRLRRHDVLYRRGDPARELFMVQSGTIAIANVASDGRESLVELVGAGELFGVCSLFDGGHRSMLARALETSTVVAVPYEPVRRALEQRPRLLWGLMRLLARRLRHVDQVLADSAFLDVTGRTAKRLLELAGDREEFQLPVTQEELAAMVGASRERVNKSLSTFVRLGWLHQRDRRYRVLDRGQLEKRAGVIPAD